MARDITSSPTSHFPLPTSHKSEPFGTYWRSSLLACYIFSLSPSLNANLMSALRVVICFSAITTKFSINRAFMAVDGKDNVFIDKPCSKRAEIWYHFLSSQLLILHVWTACFLVRRAYQSKQLAVLLRHTNEESILIHNPAAITNGLVRLC